MAVSCDPSSLANAAACFASCAPGPQGQAIKTYLLCQYANKGPGGSAPVFVRSGNAGTVASASTLSVVGFNATGGNFLLVGVTWRTGILRTITSITANGVAMNLIDSCVAGSANGRLFLYGLANPTSGDIIVTWNNTIAQGIAIGACLFSGVTTTGTPANSVSLVAVNTISITPVSVTTDLVVDALSFLSTTGVAVLNDASQTQLLIQDNGNTFQSLAMSSKPGAAGTTTMTWNASGAGEALSLDGVALHGV